MSRHFAGYSSVGLALETIWLHEPRVLIFLGPLMALLCLSRYVYVEPVSPSSDHYCTKKVAPTSDHLHTEITEQRKLIAEKSHQTFGGMAPVHSLATQLSLWIVF